jgi:glc operon protein GlcG
VDETSTSDGSTSSREGLSRRQALGYGGLATAGLVAAQAAGGSPASGAERGGSLRARTISLTQAERIVRAAVRYVDRTGLPKMYVLVVDACGDEKASARMDGNGAASVALVPIKAHTARSFRTATTDLADRTTDPARIASFTAAGFSLLGGGRPIFDGDELIGAIGVGGGSPEEDDEVARAALGAL